VLSYKTDDGKLLFAQSGGHRAWLWASPDADETSVVDRMKDLIALLGDAVLPGVSAAPDTGERFARLYAEANSASYCRLMTIEAYECPVIHYPHGVKGTVRKAAAGDETTVAEYFAGFSEAAYGIPVEPSSQLEEAKGAIASGNLYLRIVDGEPVSMANIAHRSPRHGRINAVYTPGEHRKKGYASATVAELCAILEAEGLTPMLYADAANPDANRAYRKIGFQARGEIAEIRFE